MRRIQASLLALAVGTATAMTGGTPAFANNQHPGNATMKINGGGAIVIAEEFSDAGWQGSVLTATSSRSCLGTTQRVYATNVPNSPAWNDIISSAQMFSVCEETLWDDANCHGAAYDIGPGAKVSFGSEAINDKTTCITFLIQSPS